ncbi:MAG: DUF1700 domain-containing protein [Lachnospiraceae bacterium]|nr:DUF1700 domain-containing protein [Lachnospiraceae bacterium]
MNKDEFIARLRGSLVGLSQEDIDRSADYYEEMIEDRMDDGMPEEEAVAALGSIADIRAKILEEIPISRIVKEKITPKRAMRGGEIALLILGSPLWIPLVLTAIICGLVLYLCFWVLILTLYIVDFAVFISGFAGVIAGVIQGFSWNASLFVEGCGIALIGAAILLFFGFNQVSKGMLFISKKVVLGIKKMFVGGKVNE